MFGNVLNFFYIFCNEKYKFVIL